MIGYPSITGDTGQKFREFDAYVFDKLDGRNIMAEWTRKRGFYKFGTRERLFDSSDKEYAGVIPLFNDILREQLERTVSDQRWQKAIIYMEYWGPQSFAGRIIPGDDMRLTIIDAAANEIGLLLPRDFLKIFKDTLPIAEPMGKVRWTRGYVDRVYEGEVPCSFEGVVGKANDGRMRFMAKAKTRRWCDKVHALYAPEEADKIITS